MLHYHTIVENEPHLVALTSLTRAEFEHLVPHFAASFADALQAQTIDGYERVGRAYTSYRNSPLPAVEDKLLFILVYLKQYPTQTVHGQLFGLSQSNANTWIHLLHPVLQEALARGGYLPQRSAAQLEYADHQQLGGASDAPSLFSTTGPNARSTGPLTPMNRPSTTVARRKDIR